MPTKVYKLRQEYEEAGFTGGSVKAGLDGETLDIVEALDNENNDIRTDDPYLQSVLDGYWGQFGPVFDQYVFDDDGQLTAFVFSEQASSDEMDSGMTEGERVSVQSQRAAVMAVPGSTQVPEAVHDDSTQGYGGMPVHELREVANERGLKVKASANKSELIAALEQADSEGSAA